ncbi:MAG TPA: hypothetical protein VHD76_21600 [Bryobacteraceae bacterium]|jgi:hypothetical protein|nr:hypothetical protein [Bryobacteraceae bacterium]
MSFRHFPLFVMVCLAVWLAGCQKPRRAAAPQEPTETAPPPPTPAEPAPAPPPPPSKPVPPPSGDHKTSARPPTASERPTGRGWLVGNAPERPGFGLYSYLLFGALPSDATRPLYVAVVKASLGKVEPIERKVEAGFTPSQLNLYLIPLYKEPPSDIKPDDLPGWIVDNYNYSRAANILGAVPRHGSGVYIISVLGKPIDPSHPLAPPYLWQDLTHVEPSITSAWIQYFLDQSAKDKPWDESTGEKLALEMRNYIELVANQTQATLPAMATALKWFKPEA